MKKLLKTTSVAALCILTLPLCAVAAGTMNAFKWSDATAGVSVYGTGDGWTNITLVAAKNNDPDMTMYVGVDANVHCVLQQGDVHDWHLTYWGQKTDNFWLNGSKCNLTAAFQNTSQSKSYTVVAHMQYTNIVEDDSGDATAFLSANSSCSASVSDVDFGKVSAGDTATASLDITHSGFGSIKVAGSDMDDKGVVKLGGRDDVTVQPVSTADVDTDGHWWASANQTSIALKLNAGSTAPGGKLTSNLTATLTCS
ncbi:hypothetical protein V5K00_RS23320 [Enterobacter asburiae]